MRGNMLSCFLAVLYAEASRRRGTRRCFQLNVLICPSYLRTFVQPFPNPCRNFDVLRVFDLERR